MPLFVVGAALAYLLYLLREDILVAAFLILLYAIVDMIYRAWTPLCTVITFIVVGGNIAFWWWVFTPIVPSDKFQKDQRVIYVGHNRRLTYGEVYTVAGNVFFMVILYGYPEDWWPEEDFQYA